VIAAIIGFGMPLAWWAVPGGRGSDSLGQALLFGVAMTALLSVYNIIRGKSRGAALEAGRALREEHRAGRSAAEAPRGGDPWGLRTSSVPVSRSSSCCSS